MGFNERNFQRAQENFQQLAEQLNEFTQWALEELKSRDRELKETQIHLEMAKKQINLLVGELADAKREIEDLKERLNESGQVIEMPTKEIIVTKPKPEETYDELLQRASFIQKQMGTSVQPTQQQASGLKNLEQASDHHRALFEMDLEQSGLGMENPAAIHASAKPSEHVSPSRGIFSMDLQETVGEPSLVEKPDQNFFAPAITALKRGEREAAITFLRTKEAEWQAGDPEMIHSYFDLMDRLVLVSNGYESVVRDGFVQMIRFAVAKGQFEAIRTFLQLNHGSLETILLAGVNTTETLMDLSVLYFQMSMKYEFTHWLRINRDRGTLQSINIQNEQSWSLLYMALFFDQDEVIKENLQGMKEKILLPIPEAKLYREYVDAIRDGRYVDSAQKQFDDRVTFMRCVEPEIRERVFPMMKERLQAKAEQIRFESESATPEANATVTERVAKPEVALVDPKQTTVEKLTQVEEVYLVGGEGKTCLVDETILSYEEVSLKTFRSKSERDLNQVGSYQTVRLLHCSKCNRYYINQFIRWGIAGFIRLGSTKEMEGHQIS